jgi:hypothetical protein
VVGVGEELGQGDGDFVPEVYLSDLVLVPQDLLQGNDWTVLNVVLGCGDLHYDFVEIEFPEIVAMWDIREI